MGLEKLFRKTKHLVSRQMWIPDDRNLYKLLTDWGGLIGGVFALIAGWFAYRAGQHQAKATLDATHDQIAADDKKDRSQAHALAVVIYPEILLVKVNVERIMGVIKVKYESSNLEENIFNAAFVDKDTPLDFKIVEPPLIRENGHRLFVMGEAGATIFQLLGAILQYNRIVDTLAIQVTKDTISLDELIGQLGITKGLVNLAQQEIGPIHDQA